MNHNIKQGYFNLSMDQAEPSQMVNNNQQHSNNEPNIQQSSINNVEMSMNTSQIHETLPAARNATFEFYLPISDDTRIFHVTYTELHPHEIARLLNNSINLSHIPQYRLPYHYNIQSLINQQIQQTVKSDAMMMQPDYIYNAASTPSNDAISMKD